MFGRVFLSFLSVILISSSSFACPDLTGSWACMDQQLKFKISSEKVLDTNFLKVSSNQKLIMPNETIYVLEAGNQYKGRDSYIGICDVNSVVIKMLTSKPDSQQDSFVLIDNDTLGISLVSTNISTICKRFSPLN